MFYRIGEVAKMCSISSETLRHYDRIGLLEPSKKAGNLYRYYTDSQIELILTIQHLSNLGISLENIKNIISTTDLKSFRTALLEQGKAIDKQIEELEMMKFGIVSLTQKVDQCENVVNPIVIKYCPKLYSVLFAVAKNTENESYDQLIDIIEMLPDEWLRTTEYMYMLSKELFVGDSQSYSKYGITSEYQCDSKDIEIEVIPSHLCATLVYLGKENELEQKCTDMYKWLLKGGYTISSNPLVFYKINFAESEVENTQLIEIWIPVEKNLTL